MRTGRSAAAVHPKQGRTEEISSCMPCGPHCWSPWKVEDLIQDQGTLHVAWSRERCPGYGMQFNLVFVFLL